MEKSIVPPAEPEPEPETPKKPEGGKIYRITYRNEVYVRAESEDDAKAEFEAMPRATLDSKSEFAEIVSVEPQD